MTTWQSLTSKMNKRYVNKLHKDLKKYSEQIGISEEDIPELVTDRYQLRDAIMERNGDPSISNETYFKYKGRAGFHVRGLELIYVNCHQRYQKETKKQLAYTNFLWVLIHELVHYRFEDELEHGREFDHRIREIIRGRIFPQMKTK
jgi:hypothetical protein